MFVAVILRESVGRFVTESGMCQFWFHSPEKTPPVGRHKHDLKKTVKGLVGCC